MTKYVVTVIVCLIMLLMSEAYNGTLTTLYRYLCYSTDGLTDGFILRSDVRYKEAKYGPTKSYSVWYAYTVDGELYTSNYVRHGLKTDLVSETITKYPKSKEVEVYYDPERPSVSVLEKSGISYAVGIQILGVIMLGLACLYVLS
jgi:hypothetical protein